MRIISKVRDYYDCGQAYGQDPDLMYLRRPDEYILLSGDQWIDRLEDVRDTMPRSWHSPNLHRFIIGFCGRIYPGYKFSYCYHRLGVTQGKDQFTRLERVLYHPDDFKDLFRYKAVQKAFPHFMDKPKGRSSWWSLRQMRNTNFQAVVQTYEANFASEAFFDLFIEMNSPIWIYDPSADERCRSPRRKGTFLKINDRLEPYDFVRIQDPYTAYQELSMFVGGVLRRDVPIMVPISDESMLRKKGFHDYSFKTRPKEGNK